MSEQKIVTQHPHAGKSGRSIDLSKYQIIKSGLLKVLRGKELTHNELFEQLIKELTGKFSGNISWYGETLKLDLEARGVIERFGSKPQKYRLK